MSKSRIQQIGLLAPGPDWQRLYQPALERLADRVRVAAVFDPCVQTCREIAGPLEAEPVLGIRALFDAGLNGVVCSSNGWLGNYPLSVAAAARVPFYGLVAQDIDDKSLAMIALKTKQDGTLITPELRLRYQPSTLRLKELCATSLGEITGLQVEARVPTGEKLDVAAVELLDWITNLFRHSPYELRATQAGDSTDSLEMTLKFTGPNQTIQTGTLSLSADAGDQTSDRSEQDRWSVDQIPIECTVQCQHGEARLEDAVTIRWRSGGRERVESLSTERSSVAVGIDLFARRLAGGLIPVASIEDILFARQLLKLAGESAAENRPVRLGIAG